MAVGNAPGATVNDIPWLKLDVVNRRGSGTLADVTTVQRINTHGGAAQGGVRSGRRLSQRPLFRRLRLPQQAQITRRAKAAGRRASHSQAASRERCLARDALAAWRRFRACLQVLPRDEPFLRVIVLSAC